MKMTIFYRKSTGDLTDIVQGEQNFDMYGNLKSDYQLIFDFIIIDFDEYVIQNKFLFIVIEGKLKLKDSEAIEKYL